MAVVPLELSVAEVARISDWPGQECCGFELPGKAVRLPAAGVPDKVVQLPAGRVPDSKPLAVQASVVEHSFVGTNFA